MKVSELRKLLEYLDDDCIVAVRTGVAKFIAITTIGGKDRAIAISSHCENDKHDNIVVPKTTHVCHVRIDHPDGELLKKKLDEDPSMELESWLAVQQFKQMMKGLDSHD